MTTRPILFATLMLASVALASAAIDGTIANGTTGKPEAGVAVTLFKLSQAGPEPIENTKSDAQGKFHFGQTPGPGPTLIEADWDGVTYNLLVPPGTPTTGLELNVFNASKNTAIAKIEQHMLVLEPSGAQLTVNDSYVIANSGNLTYNDPRGGTLHVFIPDSASAVKVSAQEPRGLPLDRDAEKTKTAGVYKVDFPIKPGETQINVAYSVPLSAQATFSSRNLSPDSPLRLVVPNGVTLKGEGLNLIGQEPKTQAAIYETRAAQFQVEIQGTGSLRVAESENNPGDSADDDGPAIQTIPPRVYGRMPVVLVAVFAALGLGFVLLYRRNSVPIVAPADSKSGGKRRR